MMRTETIYIQVRTKKLFETAHDEMNVGPKDRMETRQLHAPRNAGLGRFAG